MENTMFEIEDYAVATGQNSEEIGRCVKIYLQKGFVPLGGVSQGKCLIIQAMVKYKILQSFVAPNFEHIVPEGSVCQSQPEYKDASYHIPDFCN